MNKQWIALQNIKKEIIKYDKEIMKEIINEYNSNNE